MLQFITQETRKYSIIEQVKMAINGGCRWIKLCMNSASVHDMKTVAEEIIPLCQETDTILVLDHRVELTMELKVHGVHLNSNDMPIRDAREYLGAGAIIGISANTATEVIATRGLDVDYVELGPYRSADGQSDKVLGLEGYTKIVAEIRNASIELPIVAVGDITIEDIPQIMSTGVNGIAMSKAIINAENPVEYIQQILNELYK